MHILYELLIKPCSYLHVGNGLSVAPRQHYWIQACITTPVELGLDIGMHLSTVTDVMVQRPDAAFSQEVVRDLGQTTEHIDEGYSRGYGGWLP